MKKLFFLLFSILLLLCSCRETITAEYSYSSSDVESSATKGETASTDSTASNVSSKVPSKVESVSSKTENKKPLTESQASGFSSAPSKEPFKEPDPPKECTTHSYGDWVVVKEATTSSAGLKESTCTVCGNKKTEDIPKKVVSNNDSDGGIDPAVTVEKHPLTKQPLYILGKCRVLDKRTWGDPPSIKVFNGNSMHVTYYNKNNEKVEFDVIPMEDMTEYILRFTIQDDGTYVSQLTGSYS